MGGHLVSAFARLFPDVVDQAFTFNGAGINAGPGAGFDSFAGLLGNISQPIAVNPGTTADSSTTNVIAEPGRELVPATGELIGSQELVFIEQQFLDVNNHRIGHLTDALAVAALMETIAPDIELSTASEILYNSSNDPDDSLEKFVNALTGLFNINAMVDVTDRDQLYTAIESVRTALGQSPNLSFVSLEGMDAATLAENATYNVATLYALVNLNPFTVSGDAATTQALYQSFIDSGELNFENYSDAYLNDRSLMLSIMLDRDGSDQPHPTISATGGSPVFFDDHVTGEDFITGQVDLPNGVRAIQEKDVESILFGRHNGNDRLVGGDQNDRIYGIGGADNLDGGAGSDYLEGGAGNDGYWVDGVQTEIDTLVDSGSDDDYYNITGSGNVDITDAGGNDDYIFDDFSGTTRLRDNGTERGSITIFDQDIAATMIPVEGLANTWDSPGTDVDTRVQFELQGNELTITTDDLGRIIIENFNDGDFGIRLMTGAVEDNTNTEVTSRNDGIDQLTAVIQIPESRLEPGSPDIFASFKIISNPQGEPKLSIAYLTFLIDGDATRADIHEQLQPPLIQELVDIMAENTTDPELQAQLVDFQDESISDVDYRAKVVIEPREVVDDTGATNTQNVPIIYFSEVTEGTDESTPFVVDPDASIAANPDGTYEQTAGDLRIIKQEGQVIDIELSDASPFAGLNFGLEFNLHDVGRYFNSTIGHMIGEVDPITFSVDSAFFSAVGDKLDDTLSFFTDEGTMRESVIGAFEDVYNSIGIINDALISDLVNGFPELNFSDISESLSDLFDGLLSVGNGNEFDISFDSLNQIITDYASEFYNTTLPEEITDSVMSELTAEFNWNESETAAVRSNVKDYVDVLLNTQRRDNINLSELNAESKALLLDLMNDDLAALLVGTTTVLDLATDYYTNEFADDLTTRIVGELGQNQDINAAVRPLIQEYTQGLIGYSVGNNVDFALLNQEAKAVSLTILRNEVNNYVTETIVAELNLQGDAANIVNSIVGNYTSELTSVFTDGQVDFSDANANLRAQVPALSALLTAELISNTGLDGAMADLVQTLGTQYITEVLSYLTGADNSLDFEEINSQLVNQFGALLVNTAQLEASNFILDWLGIDGATPEGQLISGIVNDYVGEALDFLVGNSVDFAELNSTLDNRIGDFVSGAIARGLAEETGLSVEHASALVDIGSTYLGFGGGNEGMLPGTNGDLGNSNQLEVGTGLNGALSSLITSQLVSGLGIHEGPLADFATVAGTAVIGQMISNISTGSPLFEGVGDINFTQMGLNIVAAYIGREIGEEVYEVETTEGAIGASLGTTIGASAGARIGFKVGGSTYGFIGAIVGAVVGYVVGGIFGDWLGGGRPESGATVVYDDSQDEFIVTNIWNEGHGSQVLARRLATSAADILNEIIGTIGGEIVNLGALYGGTYGMRADKLTYQQGDRNSGRTDYFGTQAFEMITQGVLRAIDNTEVLGGNIYAKRAIFRGVEQMRANDIPDDALQTLVATLTTATDYAFYQENAEEINALIKLQPDSVFAAGWIMTLEHARELGITQRYHTDHSGGWEYLMENETSMADTPSGIREVEPNYADVELRFENNGRVVDIERRDGTHAIIDDPVSGSTKEEIAFTNQSTLNAQLKEVTTSAVIIGTDGNDVINAGDLGNDVLGGVGNDTITGGKNADWLFGGEGDDTLNAVAGSNNALFGEAGNDVLNGGASDDWLSGGAGADTLNGGGGRDILEGGAGNDDLQGQAGNDTYIFRLGDGQDTIYDVATAHYNSYQEAFSTAGGMSFGATFNQAFNDGMRSRLGSEYAQYTNLTDRTLELSGGIDTIEFGEGISIQDVNIRKGGTDNQDLIIRFYDSNGILTNDILTIQNWVEVAYRVEKIRFNDGQVIDLANVESFFVGDNNDNVIIGTNGNDFIHGGAGNDLIRALAGNDVAIGGLGNDTVSGDADDDLVIGGDGEDNLSGGTGNDIISGDQGNDALFGGSGGDVLSGGAGNDHIDGGAGSDTVIFGVGDGQDSVKDSGTSLNLVTVYDGTTFQNGYNINSIWDNDNRRLSAGYALVGSTIYRLDDTGTGSAAADNNDVLEFKRGVDLDTIRVHRDGDDLLIAVEEFANARTNIDEIADHVRLTDWFTPNGATMETIRVFGVPDIDAQAINLWLGGDKNDNIIQGSSGRDWITSGAGQDEIRAGAGNDIISAGADDDFIEAGAGADMITGGSGIDTLSYETSSSGVEINLATGRGSAGDADGDVVEYVENLVGSSNADVLIGDEFDNKLAGGLGSDRLVGGQGDDTYIYNRGDGNLEIDDDGGSGSLAGGGLDGLRFGTGINPGDLDFQRIDFDLWVSIEGTSDSIVMKDWFLDTSNRIEMLEFVDSDALDIRYQLFNDYATNSSDWVAGTQTSDDLIGLGGNDILAGRAGDDILNGGAGDDILFGGEGADQFIGGEGTDTVAYYGATAGITVALDNSVASIGSTAAGDTFGYVVDGQAFLDVENIIGSSFNDTIIGNIDSNHIQGGSGNDLIQGGAGSDILQGADGIDQLEGQDGQDELWGGYGNDLLFGGSGDDRIYGEDDDDTLYGNANNDVLMGGGGQDILYGGSDQDQLLGGLDDDTLYGNSGADDLKGGNGEDTLFGGTGNDALFGEKGNDQLHGEEGDDYAAGAAGNDIITGGAGRDVLKGGVDNDQLDGGNDDDFLDGGAGDDVLLGGAGSDFLTGGEGNDQLEGGSGEDFYVFSGDFGSDVVVEVVEDSVVNEVVFSGYSNNRLWFTEDNNDLIISLIGTDNQVRVVDYAQIRINADAAGAVEDFLVGVFTDREAADSLRVDVDVLSIDKIDALLAAMSAFAEPATVDDIPSSVADIQAELWEAGELRALDARLEHAPVLEGQTQILQEGADVSGQLQATDLNPGATFTYSIVNQPAFGSLALDSTTGAYTYQAPEEFSGGDLEVIAVVAAQDSTGRVDEATLRFNVSDIDNTGTSTFDLQLAGSIDAQVLGDIQLTDPNIDISEYTLTTDPTGNTIITATERGSVALTASGQFIYTPDSQGIDNFSLLVIHPSGNQTITVNATVNEESDISVQVDGNLLNINENAAVDLGLDELVTEPVGRINASGTNNTATYRYTLTDNANGRFRMTDNTSGNIYAVGRAMLNYEENSEIVVEIKAEEIVNGNPTGNFTIELLPIALNDIDEAATAVSLEQLQVIDNFTDYSNPVSRVVVVDPDSNIAFQQHIFELPNNADGVFEIDATTGDIYVTDPEKLANQRYEIRPRVINSTAVDPQNPVPNEVYEPEESLEILVTDINRAPIKIGDQPGILIDEYSTIQNNPAGRGSLDGDIVYSNEQLSSLFNDVEGDSLTYTIISQERRLGDDAWVGPGDGRFTIPEQPLNEINIHTYGLESFEVDNAGNIVISNAADLTYEGYPSLQPQYQLKVVASDGLYTSSYATITVNLQDLDEIGPMTGEPAINSLFDFSVGASPMIPVPPFDETIVGTNNPETLYGTIADDLILGEGGDDTLSGNAGGDNYGFNLGDGVDTVIEQGTENTNTLAFGAGIAAEDLELGFDATTGRYELRYSDTDKVIFGSSASSSITSMDSIYKLYLTDDNTEIWMADMLNRQSSMYINRGTSGNDYINSTITRNAALFGEAGNDTLSTGVGNDHLYGGTGDDVLTGGSGDDTYYFELGDGVDQVYESNGDINDVLRFGQGISSEDVELVVNINTGMYELRYSETDRVVFGNNANSSYDFMGRIEAYYFYDGTVLTQSSLLSRQGGYLHQGTSGNDNIYLTRDEAGIVYSDSGSDTLQTGNGSDHLYGGTGNDFLYGEAGDDVYYFSLGDGIDLVYESFNAGNDALHFGGGISSEDVKLLVDINTGIYELRYSETDLIRFGTHSSNSEGSMDSIEAYHFYDGTVLTQQNLLDRQGFYIHRGTDSNDYISQGVGRDDMVLAGEGDDLVNSGNGNDALYGGSGNDSLSSDAGNDHLYGGSGDDTLLGGSGDDTYYFELGDGADQVYETINAGNDILRFGEGISSEDVELHVNIDTGIYELRYSETDLIRFGTHSSNSEGSMDSIEAYHFYDGTVLTQQNLLDRQGFYIHRGTDSNDYISQGVGRDDMVLAGEGDDLVNSGNGNDALYGGSGNDSLSSDAGDDHLYGGSGDDTLFGGSGDDTYYFELGDGADQVYETINAGNDILHFGEGISSEDVELHVNIDTGIYELRYSETDLLTSTLTSVKSLRKPCNMREELGLCFVVPS